jgi:hypothetical protein
VQPAASAYCESAKAAWYCAAGEVGRKAGILMSNRIDQDVIAMRLTVCQFQ